MSDPLLQELDEILDRHIGQHEAKLFFDLRRELRALMADVAIEYYDLNVNRAWRGEIRQRFGVEEKP